MPIRFTNDTLSLQHDLDQFPMWSSLNCMPGNTSKCVNISFDRSIFHINSQYNINGISHHSANQVLGLCIILSSDSSFNAHVEAIYRRSLRVLRFIKRTCHDFNAPLCLKVLYCAFVKSSLEFGMVLWYFNQMCLTNKLEKVQRSFLHFHAYKTKMLNHNIDEVANVAGFKSLKTRRLVLYTNFVFKILNGDMDCPELL